MTPVLFLPYVGICLVLWAVLALPKIQRQQKDTLTLVSISLLIGYFYYIILSFATDIAFTDDFAILDSFDRLLYSDKGIDKLKALLSQVNEHRFVFERFLVGLIYLFTGTASPFLQIAVGNLFLLGITFLLFRFFRESRLPLYYFVPVILVIFSLLYYENAFWAVAAIQNTPVIFFTILSAWSLARQSRNGTIIAFLSAAAATLTSGSGMAIWVIGTIFLLLQKRYRVLVLWLGVAGTLLTVYFTFDYTLSPRDRSGLLSHPFTNFRTFLAFMGSLFAEGYEYGERGFFKLRTLAAVLAGGLIFAVALVWFLYFLRNPLQKKPTGTMMTGLLLFVMATAAMLVISRPLQSTNLITHHMFSSRYLIFSVTIWAGIYLILLHFFKNKPSLLRLTLVTFFVVNAALNFASYYSFIPVLAAHKSRLELDKLYTDNHKYMLMSFGELYGDKMFWNHPTAFGELVERLKEHKLYDPRLQPEPHVLDEIQKVGYQTPASEWTLTRKAKKTLGFANRPAEITYFNIRHPNCPAFQPRYFVLRSDTNLFVLPAIPRRSHPSTWLQRASFWACEYQYDFYTTKFPEGEYRLYLISENDGAVRGESVTDKLVISYDF